MGSDVCLTSRSDLIAVQVSSSLQKLPCDELDALRRETKGISPQLLCQGVLHMLHDHVNAAAFAAEGLVQVHDVGVDRSLEQLDLPQH